MDIYAQIVIQIIEQQESVMGPVALQQARQVNGITVDWDKHHVSIVGDAKQVIDKLVAQYKDLFGQIAVEVSKEAAAKFTAQLSEVQVPESLK